MGTAVQQTSDPSLTADSLKQAVQKAKDLDYTNGMATEPVVVERETETLSVIRKAVHPAHPERILFIARPRNGYVEPSVHALAGDIEDAAGLYGDVNVKPKQRNRNTGAFDCVLPARLF